MLTYSFSPRDDDSSWLPGSPYRGPESGDGPRGWEFADGNAYTFDYFRANISFKIDGVDFGSDDPEQTIIDYCLMLNLACRELQARRGSQVESATGSFRMYFIREGDALRMASDRVEAVGIVSIKDFHAAVSGLLGSAMDAIASVHPEVEHGDYWRI